MEEAAIRNQDGRAALHGVSQQVVEALQGHLFVEDGEQAAVQAQDNAGLGRGEEACQNTAHDDDDGQQRGHCINDDLDGGIGILDVRGLVAFLDRDEHSQTSDTQTHQDAGQVAAHEQSSNGNAASGDGVQDQRTRRGDQDAGRSRADVDGRRVVGVITLIQLQRSHDGAHCGSSCNGRTGNRTEEHVCQNVGGSQVTGHLTNGQTGQTDKALCNAALVHDVAAQREERQSQQRERVNAGEAALCRGQCENRGVHAEQGREDGCDADACRDRHTGQQHHKKGTEQQ